MILQSKKTGKQLHYEARKAIFKYLDKTSITNCNSIKFYGTETSFNINEPGDYGVAKRTIFFDALQELDNDLLITSSSSVNQLPIHGLKLTPKGLKRPKNPIEEFKDDGIKAFISASMSSIGRYLLKKFDDQK
jgi:hypothetical protein